MKTGRAITIAAAALVVLVVVAAWLLLRSLDAIVGRAIEHYGSAATGTEVSVRGVEIDLRNATGGLSGLRIANPPGYEGDAAFALGGIEISLDAGSLGGEPIVIRRVHVDEPVVHFEIDERGRSNVGRIREHAESRQPAETEPPPGTGEPAKLAIRELVFEKGTIRASAPGAPEQQVVLPSFTLRDLGGARGDTGAGIARQVLLELSRRVVVAVGGSRLKEELGRRIDEELGGEAGEAAKGLLDRVLQ